MKVQNKILIVDDEQIILLYIKELLGESGDYIIETAESGEEALEILPVFKPDLILTGFILGLVNFGSLYGIIMALDSKVFDSSIVFGINNIGIVLLSVAFALLIFKERISSKNKIGIVLSLISIIILSLV